jgi:hypothetical protein
LESRHWSECIECTEPGQDAREARSAVSERRAATYLVQRGGHALPAREALLRPRHCLLLAPKTSESPPPPPRPAPALPPRPPPAVLEVQRAQVLQSVALVGQRAHDAVVDAEERLAAGSGSVGGSGGSGAVEGQGRWRVRGGGAARQGLPRPRAPAPPCVIPCGAAPGTSRRTCRQLCGRPRRG